MTRDFQLIDTIGSVGRSYICMYIGRRELECIDLSDVHLQRIDRHLLVYYSLRDHHVLTGENFFRHSMGSVWERARDFRTKLSRSSRTSVVRAVKVRSPREKNRWFHFCIRVDRLSFVLFELQRRNGQPLHGMCRSDAGPYVWTVSRSLPRRIFHSRGKNPGMPR